MREVWVAADEVAAKLCAGALVRQHARAMGTWQRVDPPDHVRRVLHEDPFSAAYERHSLFMGLPYADGPSGEAMVATVEGEGWFRGAVQVALGFGRLVEWLRSRLAGYPRLLVPQLGETSVRANESGFFFGPGFPWWRIFRDEAPQFQSQVNVETLELSGRDSDALRESVSRLGATLSGSQEWLAFRAAQGELDDGVRRELRELGAQYRDRSRDDVLDAIEPRNMLRRHQYLEAVMRDVLAGASSATDRYLVAFQRVDELISAVARVVEELVVYGPPTAAGAVAEGTWSGGRFGYHVRLKTTGDAVLIGGIRMVEVSSEVQGLAGAVLTDSHAVSLRGLNMGDGMATRSAVVTGELLPGSAGVLGSGPAR